MDRTSLDALPALPTATPLDTGRADIRFHLLRLDLLDTWATGNKYYKLKYYLEEARSRGISHVISKGGPFSNHLAALAQACATFGLRLTCIVRAYRDDPDNPTLRHIRALGGDCRMMDPHTFSAFGQVAASAIDPAALFIPEGANGSLGWRGTAEIVDHVMRFDPTHVVLPAGTFGTALGVLSVAPADWQVIMIPAWKGCTTGYVADLLSAADISPRCRWSVWPDHHAGGFGRYDETLRRFMHSFTAATRIVLEPVYTGKMLKATLDAVQAGFFPSGSRVVAVHTGGLQGLAGYRYRFPVHWSEYPE
jgi:1-aminocyclopropane-1-carboxylate deaminase